MVSQKVKELIDKLVQVEVTRKEMQYLLYFFDTQHSVAEILQQTNLGRSTIFLYLKAMVKKGLLIKEFTKGKYDVTYRINEEFFE